MESNSKKTLWIIVIIGILVIVLVVGYLVMQANRGRELLENNNNVPENIPQGVQEGANSANIGTGQPSAQPTGLDQSALGDLNSGINQLDQDINKL